MPNDHTTIPPIDNVRLRFSG